MDGSSNRDRNPNPIRRLIGQGVAGGLMGALVSVPLAILMTVLIYGAIYIAISTESVVGSIMLILSPIFIVVMLARIVMYLINPR